MSAHTVINPATALPLAELTLAGAAEVDEAVMSAAAAFKTWRHVPPRDRARMLRLLGDLLERDSVDLALTETRNVGKPLRDSRDEVAMSADVFHYYAGAVDKHFGQTIPVAGGIDMTFREPLGVVGVIVPWNFPLAIACWNVAPALAAGNTVVLKPSELTPLTALKLADLALEAGLPDGVLSVVVGAAEAGQRLVDHPDVRKISFTGSTAVGKSVMSRGAATLKRLTLELGGKAPNVVFADADLALAARSAVPAVFGNSGQDCCSRARVLVQREVHDEFLELFVQEVRRLRVGDPEDGATDMGPLVSADHLGKVTAFLSDGRTTVHTGVVPDGPGFWFPPAVVSVGDEADPLAQDEVFGPIAAVMTFIDENDAIRIANGTPYGLSASVWTADIGRAIRTARALEVGTLSINSNSSVRVSTPFGGMKESGLGRELGMQGLDANSEVKNVFVAT